jgi:hypothetical protein
MAEDIFLNDVVSLDNNGFWATNRYPKTFNLALIGSILGFEYGQVVQWTQEAGLVLVEGSDGSFPNGIEKSADEQFMFVNHYTGNLVVKFNLDAKQIVATASIVSPDNLTWDTDNRHLLVASQLASLTEMGSCQVMEPDTNCPISFEIIRIDTKDMSQESVYLHAGGAPMGAATVALAFDGYIYLGTFAGDRIARIRYSN